MWFRTTLYAIEGQWGEGTVADLVITAYHQDQKIPSPIKLGVSTWRRSPDVSLPARAKSGANYQVARLARIEGRSHGWQDMVLLNNSGRVAEATGSCLVMVRDGTVYTPPATEGALESITLDIVEALAHSMKMPFIRRPIDRTELLVADEIAICGTLANWYWWNPSKASRSIPNLACCALCKTDSFELRAISNRIRLSNSR